MGQLRSCIALLRGASVLALIPDALFLGVADVGVGAPGYNEFHEGLDSFCLNTEASVVN